MKKSTSLLRLIFFGSLTAVLASCSYSSYVPVTVYEPMLAQKGERQAVVYMGSNHIELQGAYAVTNHFGMQADIWKATDKRFSMEVLPGYYYHAPNGFCFGMYSGFGMSNTSGTKEYVYSDWFNNYHEKFINEVRYTSMIWQPGVGYRSKFFEIGFASRISYVTFSQYDVKYYSWDDNEDAAPVLKNAYRDNRFNLWVFQPSLNVSAGLEHIKAFFSASLNIPSNLQGVKNGYHHPYFQPYLIASGVKVDLMAPKKFKKNQKLEF